MPTETYKGYTIVTSEAGGNLWNCTILPPGPIKQQYGHPTEYRSEQEAIQRAKEYIDSQTQ